MTNQPNQKITPLTAEDQRRFQDQRAIVEKYLPDEGARRNIKQPQANLV